METFYGTFRRCVVQGCYFRTRAKLQRRVQISSARAFVYFTFTKGLGDFSGCDASSLSSSMKLPEDKNNLNYNYNFLLYSLLTVRRSAECNTKVRTFA